MTVCPAGYIPGRYVTPFAGEGDCALAPCIGVAPGEPPTCSPAMPVEWLSGMLLVAVVLAAVLGRAVWRTRVRPSGS